MRYQYSWKEFLENVATGKIILEFEDGTTTRKGCKTDTFCIVDESDVEYEVSGLIEGIIIEI